MRKKTWQIRIEPWSAVRLVTHGEACSRAQALASRRFLAREAPALPLKGCLRSADCRCTYHHYADRRAVNRRGEPDLASSSAERRLTRDRRGQR